MTSSLVGSEMCIRDRSPILPWLVSYAATVINPGRKGPDGFTSFHRSTGSCLLYTSDAADDM
eukprot:2951049-Prorocentrum_lima.AAC.1